MAPPRVGVELAAPGADPGGWLAEATAYEAAGHDSLWVGTEPGANPWAEATPAEAAMIPSAVEIRFSPTNMGKSFSRQ